MDCYVSFTYLFPTMLCLKSHCPFKLREAFVTVRLQQLTSLMCVISWISTTALMRASVSAVCTLFFTGHSKTLCFLISASKVPQSYKSSYGAWTGGTDFTFSEGITLLFWLKCLHVSGLCFRKVHTHWVCSVNCFAQLLKQVTLAFQVIPNY